MKKINCNECGKELSSKAEVCPNCGVRVKKKSFISRAFRFFEIIGVLMVIVILICMLYGGIKLLNEKRTIKKYTGTWELQTKESSIIYEERIILLDKQLEIEKKNVYDGLGYSDCNIGGERLEERCEDGYPTVFMNSEDDIVGINFYTDEGLAYLICFTMEKNKITQVDCRKSSGAYKSNGGVNKEY